MKKVITLLFVATIVVLNGLVVAQQGAEYWFGPDPGSDAGIFVSGSESAVISAVTTGLEPGVYDVGIRPRSAEGVWGFASFVRLKIAGDDVSDMINAAEYFWDIDPGFGSGLSIPVEEIMDGRFVVQTTGLDLGIHVLSVRLQTTGGEWGISTQSDVTICTNYSVTADFTAEKDALTVYLTDQSEHANSVSWIVDGDLSSATSFLNPTLVLEPGNHTITQIAINECDENEVSQDVWASGIGHLSGSVITTSEATDLYIYGAFSNVESVTLHNEGYSISPITFIHADSSDVIFSSWTAPPGSDFSELDLTVVETSGESSTLEACVTVDEIYISISTNIQTQGFLRRNIWTPVSVWVTNDGNVPVYGVPLFINLEGDIDARIDLDLIWPEHVAMLEDELLQEIVSNQFYNYESTEGEEFLGTLALIPSIEPGESFEMIFEIIFDEEAEGNVVISSLAGGPWGGLGIYNDGIERTTPCGIPVCLDGLINALSLILGSATAGGSVITVGLMNLICNMVNCVMAHYDEVGVLDCHPTGIVLGVAGAAGALTGQAIIGQVLAVLRNFQNLFDDREAGFCECFLDPENCDDGDEGSATAAFSLDPNDKYGPLGWGEEHWLAEGDDTMFYRFVCENDSGATATAAEVLFIDSLDIEKLDLSTLRFHSVTYADTSIVIEEDDGRFVKEIDLRPGKNAILRIEGEVDELTGILTVVFSSLDPETGAVTFDIDAGFLNPNVIPPEGEAEVNFSVKMIEGESLHGEVVENFVDIYFDANDPIRSPVWSNTFDGIPPNILIENAEVVSDTSLVLTLGGGDNDSGIRYQKIYYYDTVADSSVLVGTFGINDTVEVVLDPSLEWNLYAMGIDGVGNSETLEGTVSAASFIEFEYGPLVCVGDFNNDMTVGVDDLLIMLAVIGLSNELSTDLNGNGATDVDDLLTFLQAFGVDCSYNL